MPLDQIDVDKLKSGSEMTFLEHIEVLRWHLIRSVASIFIVGLFVFFAKDFVFGTIVMGPVTKGFPTFEFFCHYFNMLCNAEMPQLITKTLGEQFMIHLTSSAYLAVIVSFPYILWEIWSFVRPGLYRREQKAATGIFAFASLLFFTGVLFGYFILSPFAINFLSTYSVSTEIANTVTLSSYVSYLVMFCLPTGIIFELPIVVYFLSKIGILTPDLMRKYRRHAIFIFFIIASIITPPDVVTQLIISLPLFLLYEVSVLISARVQKSQKLNEI